MNEGSPGPGKLQREAFFPTLIYYLDLHGSAKLNAPLVSAIRRLQAEDTNGMHRSNVRQAGAWHSQDDLIRRPEFEDLAKAVLASMQQVFDDLEYDGDMEPVLDNMWANVSPRHAFNRMHTHPGVIWSGVYYVQSPSGSGRIFFADPRAQAGVLRPYLSEAGKNRPENWSEVFYEPIEGRMILFPAWLLHEVEPNLSDVSGDGGHRISISFNLRQRRRSAD